MGSTTTDACAKCGKADGLKKCGRCKQTSYCSVGCQKADWSEHKTACHFTVISPTNDEVATDALSLLHQMHTSPSTMSSQDTKASVPVMKVFNTAEIRMAVFSFLPAKNLLIAQRVCRSWYVHIALEKSLQQRLFLAPGPGKLVFAAFEGNAFAMAIQPRNKSQRDHAKMIKGPAMSLGPPSGPRHLSITKSSETEENHASELEIAKVPIILNPFFTKFWSQDPKNMTNCPYNMYTPSTDKNASWRRMQLTSPPMLELDMGMWITKSNHKGNQLRPGTGRVATGVTLGDVADLLATIPKKLERHWMSLDGHPLWVRSADALVVPKAGDGTKGNDAMRGVYVNPSNGIPFPGAF